MNTKPAEPMKPGDEILALWLEGELDGPQQAEVDAWAAAHPELLAEREAISLWKVDLRGVIAADQQPPFPDFFNSRIEQALRQPAQTQPRQNPASQIRSWWRNLAVPALAAGMALCFWLGTEFRPAPAAVTVVALKEPPAVYTPLSGVTVEVVSTAGNDGTVIVLEGLAAMPDSLEVPETSGIPGESSFKLVTNPDTVTF